MLKNLLTVADNLADHTLIVTLRLSPHETQSQRPLILALGEEGQPPVFATGTLSQLPTLLNHAYDQYSQRPSPAETPVKTKPEPTESAPTQASTQVPSETHNIPQSSLSIF